LRPEIAVVFYRSKVVATLTDKMIIFKAHHHRSKRYVTAFNKHYSELFTLRDDVSPEAMYQVIMSYLANK
jgi:hypothetical protein